MSAALPNLVVIGAMKCGTTSLHRYLDCHPEIQMSDPKEVNFFAGINENRPLEWYRSLFDSNFAIRGEASQNYAKAHHPRMTKAPARMAEVIPDAKLIYLVRDPVERYASHVMENAYGDTADDIRLNIEIDTYVKTGMYHYQLEAFLKHYHLDQVKVVVLERLITNRLAVMNDIFEFLGVPPVSNGDVFDFVANDKDSKPVPTRIRRAFWYRALNRLSPSSAREIGQSTLLKKLLSPNSLRTPMPVEKRRELSERFQPDIERLGRMLQMSFPEWEAEPYVATDDSTFAKDHQAKAA